MSPTQTMISVEEYLRTSYRPDCDYIDGQVLERNMGEMPHATLQGFFGWYFINHRDTWRVDALPEQRVQVSKTHFRIPDICLVSHDTLLELIVTTPPVLCIEILSRDDRMKSIQERLDDYARMGVQTSWVVDPWRGTAFQAGPDAILHETKTTLTVPNTAIVITVDEIFAELDRLERRATTQPK